MLRTQEHYDLMAQFERDCGGRFSREDKKYWAIGQVYEHGETNAMFLAYRKGYVFGKAVERQKVEDAPIALMDTRTALGLCALAEEDFPGLYAMQGRRVRLIVDEPMPADHDTPTPEVKP